MGNKKGENPFRFSPFSISTKQLIELALGRQRVLQDLSRRCQEQTSRKNQGCPLRSRSREQTQNLFLNRLLFLRRMYNLSRKPRELTQ